MNYSVPYEYIKQQVEVRLTHSTVEIFFGGHRVASHPRLYGCPSQYSTIEAHMPSEHREYLQWNGDRFRNWAAHVGESTVAVVQQFLNANKVEQQGYKSCMTLLKFADQYSPVRLEAACRRAMTFSLLPSLKSIQSILKSGQDKLVEESEPVSTPSRYSFTRGAAYYSRRSMEC